MISLFLDRIRTNCVWSPTQDYLSTRIERVQKKFTRNLCYKSNIDYKSFDYIDRCSFFNIQPLSSRRQISDLVYLHKIINYKVNCTYLVNEITLYTPARIMRQKPLFYVKARICARKGSFLPRVLTIANMNERIDVFHFTSLYAFKRQIRQYFIWFYAFKFLSLLLNFIYCFSIYSITFYYLFLLTLYLFVFLCTLLGCGNT